jgi:hypothetical protein
MGINVQTAGIRLAALLLAFACLTACTRNYPDGTDPKAKVRGAHAWNMPGYGGPELSLMKQRPAGEATDTPRVELRPEKGPAFPTEDTIDLDRLDGFWLVVAVTHDERQQLLPVSEQDTFIFQNGRSVIYHSITNWKDNVMEGALRKTKPGVIGIKFGNGDFTDFYGMLFHKDFFYLWNYEQKTGFWMVRLPEQVTERIAANEFDTTRGHMKLVDVVATSFTGTVGSGPRGMSIHGFYNRGVISIEWTQNDRTGQGFAAFVVGPDWKSLTGAWWIDDYEAIPFSDVWDGTRGSSKQEPPA